MGLIFQLILLALWVYVMIVVITAILSWLIAFDIANARHPVIGRLWDTLVRLTEPALAPIRRVMPNLGGIDLSPVVLILLLQVLQMLIGSLAASLGYYV
ncbi:YggT family protein [Terrihabitans soli]|uniref:YggT family protein n=1 Tax=Terrihabitans soli TaxID=708113 RepID=A0A6S6QE08_9HYPH|nr:YggT family protein [Terrihabitans soli]BCJ89353.1 YggT family protein [Terrihabitans soli]